LSTCDKTNRPQLATCNFRNLSASIAPSRRALEEEMLHSALSSSHEDGMLHAAISSSYEDGMLHATFSYARLLPLSEFTQFVSWLCHFLTHAHA
jgi:hypothetical protein